MSKALETLKKILSEKLPKAEVEALVAELTSASGNGAVAIQGDATEAVIVTGNQSIVGDNNRIVINQSTDVEELARVLRSKLREMQQPESTPNFSTNSEKATFARRIISQTMTMVFVDLMRLLYVAVSDTARAANVARYSEFIDIAEQHFADLRSHLARASIELNAQLNELSLQLERRLSWILGRLKRGPDLSGNEDEYFKKMKQIGQQLNSFCTTAIGKEYENTIHQVDTHLSRAIEDSGIAVETASLNDIFRLRLYVQTQLLHNSRSVDGARIFTIADDMDQDFGIYYFALDQKLLDSSHSVIQRNVIRKGKQNINLGSAPNPHCGDMINNKE